MKNSPVQLWASHLVRRRAANPTRRIAVVAYDFSPLFNLGKRPAFMPERFHPLLSVRELRLGASRPLALDYPALAPDHAICLGLSIDWGQAEALRAFALSRTHAEEHA